jgi:hypothetical protein
MSSTRTVVPNQLYRDLAPDMVDRDRRLRVLSVTGDRAELLVEHDKFGFAGRKTRASLTRLTSSAYELLEDPADADPLYLALLNAVSEVHGPNTTPADYARAALRVARPATTER